MIYSPAAVGLGEKTCSVIICSSLRKWERKESIRVLRLIVPSEELNLSVHLLQTVLSGFLRLSNHDAYTKVNNDVWCCRKKKSFGGLKEALSVS